MVKLSELRNKNHSEIQKKQKATQDSDKIKKVAILFRGESYRDALNEYGIHSRVIGSDNTVDGQRIANNNHLDFIIHIQKKFNIKIDIFIDTQSTKYDYFLISDYLSRNTFNNIKNINFKNFAFHDKYCKTQMISTQRSINHIIHNEEVDDYDSVLILRNDIFLKQPFFELYNPFHEKVYFSFIMWKFSNRGRTLGNFPRVSDILYFIPKRYFMLLKHFKSINPPGGELVPGADINSDDPKSGGWGHEAIFYWNKIIPNFEYDFYIKTFHDSNPAIDLNPLYYMVNRKIADSYLTRQDKTYPENWNEDF